MGRNTSIECKEMIIACVTNMVHSHASRFRSGWKNIFTVFTIAASEKNEKIVEQAFATTTDIICNLYSFYCVNNSL
jgi:brefeldin A-inhibited guanine nucleotide-exchange protein